jgi:hypothetical protein
MFPTVRAVVVTDQLATGDAIRYGRHFLTVEGIVQGDNENPSGEPLTRVYGYSTGGRMKALWSPPLVVWTLRRFAST